MLKADLSGKKALVTGGSSGIGRATARLLAECGAEVAVNHLPDDPRGKETVAAFHQAGNKAHAIPGNVADPKDADRMVADAIETLGGLDILINNAGTPVSLDPIPFEDMDAMTEEFWSTIINTNLIGPFRCARAARSALTDSRGCIVNTASIAAFGGIGSSIAYAASKAGLMNLTKNLAKAMSPEVRVNAVAPGLVRTPWTDGWPEERKNTSVANSLLGRMVEPEDIAETMLFFCANGAVTGQTLLVDCGRFGA